MTAQVKGRLATLLGSLLIGGLAAGTAMAQQTAPPAPANTPAPETDWTDSAKHPVDWLKWGADLRLRNEYFNNAITLDQSAAFHEQDYQRYRARIWGTATPVQNVDFNLRGTYEGFHFTNPQETPTRDEWDWRYFTIDTANVKLTEVGGSPLSMTLGRQDLIYGDAWLILDGTPLDGSKTIYFDEAARFTLALKQVQTSVDLVLLQNASSAESWLPTVGEDDVNVIEQNERGVILYATNKSIEKTQLDGYFIYKHDDRGRNEAADGRPLFGNGDDGDIYTLGSRAVRDFTENWQGSIEGAYQWGQRENLALYPDADNTLSAWGLNSRLVYKFNDDWKHRLRISYEYLSGDDPDSATNEGFDPLWGRWPQFSELYVYTDAAETRIAETTNLHRLGFSWQADPTKQLQLELDYHILFADQNTYRDRAGFSSGGALRGNLFAAIMRYKFNRHMSGHLWGEYFIPGNYYSESRRDNAVFFRAELVFTF